MLNAGLYNHQSNPLYYYTNLYNSYMTVLYMQALQNQALNISRMAPVQVLIDTNNEKRIFPESNVKEEKISQKMSSEKSTFEDQPLISHKSEPAFVGRFSSFRNRGNCTQDRKIERKLDVNNMGSKYIFRTISSRKKEKKSIKMKMNRIISRVHNMDCLLKKIKAKYLKYLYIELRNELDNLNVQLKKFDQCGEVRNLNVSHNRDNFIDLTIFQMLLNNLIIKNEDIPIIMEKASESLKSLLNKKVKCHYHFDFLSSNYFKKWIRDPIKIMRNNSERLNIINKNCLKFPNHSKNIFSRNKEDYDIYIKLLMQTSSNFIFYFQNNPLKFGKKAKGELFIKGV